MKLIWLSVAPWAPTGYGIVTRQVVPRIQAEGHEVVVACKHFHTGTVVWNGIPTIQGMDLSMLNRMIDRGEADYIISLLDNHAIDGVPKKWISYTPFDTEKIPLSISRSLEQPLMIIALTSHGQKEIERVGYESWYAPHGIDTKIYYPDEDSRQRGREALGWQDNFVIGSVGVNYADDRKNYVNLLRAFKDFHTMHEEARLYLSVNPLHTDKNDSLTRAMQNLELDNLVKWAEPDQYFLGKVSDQMMANRYRLMDVFCLPTKGEGFGLPLIEAQACGVPVITTDASTGPELCPTQYLIPVKDDEWEWFNKEWRASVSASSIFQALQRAYNHPHLREIGQIGCNNVQRYDWDLLHEEYWKPILKEIEGLKTKVQSIPHYKKIYSSFDGRITMSDCGKWCENKCGGDFYFMLLPEEKPTDRPIKSRSYPVQPDQNGRLWVIQGCPLHSWLSRRFKAEVTQVWTELWGYPVVREHFNGAVMDFDGVIPLDDIEIDFNAEYSWAMQSQYHTNCPDLSEYLSGRVLEVGCGDGSRVKELQDKGIDAIGFEINPAQKMMLADAEAIPFKDSSFDAVYSVDVLEHLSDPLRGISEAFRVSKGVVISSITPVESAVFWQDPTHKVEWDRERWKREINEFGEIIDILEPFTVIARKRCQH